MICRTGGHQYFLSGILGRDLFLFHYKFSYVLSIQIPRLCNSQTILFSFVSILYVMLGSKKDGLLVLISIYIY